MGEQVRRFLAILIAAATVAVALASTTREASSAESEASAIDPQVALARRLLDVAGDESKPAAARAIETARMALAARRDAAPDRLLPLLDQESRNLDTTERLLGISVDESNGLEQGIDIARIATGWQAATLGMDLSGVELPAVPHHSLPSEAAIAFVKGEGGEVSSTQVEELRRFDDLPTDARSALTGFMDAFVVFSAATDLAYADADMERIEALIGDMEAGTLDAASLDITGPGSVLADLGVNLAPVFVARDRLLDTVVPLRDALTGPGASQTMSAGPDFQLAPYLSIELDLSEANTYSQDFTLQLDVGGNDTYYNNAGGAQGGAATPRPSASLVDLLGHDQYRSGRSLGINGGGGLGAGVLVDGLGNDLYLAGGTGTNGGGDVGAGFLLDATGTDSYQAADRGANGGGNFAGAGMLIDAVGDNSFSATRDGTNGGGDTAGVGFLMGGGALDTAPADTYSATDEGTNGGGHLGGVGFLLDAGLAADNYTGGQIGTNGGGGASGGVPVGGSGFLMDVSGDDRYTGINTGANGGVAVIGAALLIDAAGSDTYSAGNSGTNGGAVVGTAALVELAGHDSYTGFNGGAFLGTGLLFDAGGSDRYRPSGGTFVSDETAVPKGFFGAQIDVPLPTVTPPNTFPTIPETTVPTVPVPTTPPTVTTTSVPLPTTTLPTVTTTSVPLPTTTSVPLPPVVVVAGDAKLEGAPLTLTIHAPGASVLGSGSITGTFSTSAPPDPLAPLLTLAATPGDDYTAAVNVPVSLSASNGFSQSVTIPVADDALVELPEGILGTFTLGTGSAPAVDAAAVGLGVILPDDDLPPVPTTTTTSVPLPTTTSVPPPTTTSVPLPTTTTTSIVLPSTTTSTLPPVPPVIVVDYGDMSPCTEHLVSDPTLIEFWHSDPFTSPYSVCVLIHYPIPFQVRVTFDPDV